MLQAADQILYLDDCQVRGINAIIVEAPGYWANDPTFAGQFPDAYGNQPFTTALDISTPNPAYFARLQELFQRCLDRGIAVWITPLYLGFNGGVEGWWSVVGSQSTTVWQTYGAYFGSVISAYPNVSIIQGGDYYNAAVLTRVRALQAGIESTDSLGANRLVTYHGNPEDLASDVVGGESWLKADSVYAYAAVGNEVAEFRTAYARTPRPVTHYEGDYLNEHSVTALYLRSQMYWSAQFGAGAGFGGANPIWNFNRPGADVGLGTWQSYLSHATRQDRTRCKNFYGSLAWQSLVPDITDVFLTGGTGSGTDTAVGSKTPDGRLGTVYTPSQKALTVDCSGFAGSVSARWFNPTDASYTPVSGSPFANSGSQTKTPPSSGDWIMLLEA